MSRRSQRGPQAGERFLVRLREAIAAYAGGVHDLGAGATPAALAEAAARLGALPASVADIYRYADGMWLFDDTVRLVPLAELGADGDWLILGAVDGARLLADGEGRVFEEDEDGDRLSIGASLEEALLAFTAREGLLVDHAGEWKEVFDEEGELTDAVRWKRCEAARKRSPTGARWIVEAAELALELDGDEEGALTLLGEAIAADDGAAGPCELRGILLTARGAAREGQDALTAAAERSGPLRRADRAAAAADAARRNGDEPERSRLAAMAIAAEASIVERLRGEVESALADARLEDADRLIGLVTSLAGEDALPARARGRIKLRTV